MIPMIGQTISHYEIIEKLGEGGMGIVYKARDTKLDRFVALKFLPERLVNSEQDRARFLQEAKAASALNHPNICTIHGIEEHNGQLFIIMELIEGETLREKKNSMTFKQALDIGIQLAEGLGVAHDKGIVHRDIKPDNIMVRKDGIVQIMDFGLAKLRGVSKLTKEGSTIGTAGYMSPEQVQGQEADHRSDIFSLGVLLYELFTGQLPFKGVHESALMYEIVNVDALPMSAVNPQINPELDAIVLECIEKDPSERTQSVKQVAIDLKRFKRTTTKQRVSRVMDAQPYSSSITTAQQVPMDAGPRWMKSRSWMALGLTTVLAVALGFGIAFMLFGRSENSETLRASIEFPRGLSYESFAGGHMALSPDGKLLVFSASDSTRQVSLWIRPLSSTSMTKLTGTNGAAYPFWSSDSRSVAFFADGKLKRIDATGGPVVTIADAPQGRGGTWSREGIIVFSPNVEESNLFQVSASGGVASICTNFDSSAGFMPRFPSFLPDGKNYLFVRYNIKDSKRESEAYVRSLDGRTEKLLLKGISNMIYASGHVVYLRQSILMMQPFDPGSLEIKGEPTPLQENVNSWSARAKGDFSVALNGRLVYCTNPREQKDQLVWMDREGRQTSIAEISALSALISPDGNQIVFDEFDRNRPGWDIWKYDVKRHVKTRFSFSKDLDYARWPLWSPDGSKIIYTTGNSTVRSSVLMKLSDGSGREDTVIEAVDYWHATGMSPDGRFILFDKIVQKTGKSQAFFVDVRGDHKPVLLVPSEYNVDQAHFSPDGRWIVYQSDESGRYEVYLKTFQEEGAKYQISLQGGSKPNWRGNEIFYETENKLWVVGVTISGKTPTFGTPRELFNSGEIQIFDITKDGKSFLAGRAPSGGAGDVLSLIVNWESLAKKKN
jgi:serine/threonine protein kinase